LRKGVEGGVERVGRQQHGESGVIVSQAGRFPGLDRRPGSRRLDRALRPPADGSSKR
jgi:hypothetical protein